MQILEKKVREGVTIVKASSPLKHSPGEEDPELVGLFTERELREVAEISDDMVCDVYNVDTWPVQVKGRDPIVFAKVEAAFSKPKPEPENKSETKVQFSNYYVSPPLNITDHLAVLHITDVHVGQSDRSLADTEQEFHNLIFGATSWLIGRDDITEIIVPFGNDFLHIDSFKNQTTSGTPIEDSHPYESIVHLGERLFIKLIQDLRAVQPNALIRVVLVPGNHDYQTSYLMCRSLSNYFESDALVDVDYSLSARKYFSFGSVCLGFTHGDKVKNNDLPRLMSTEAPRYWGESEWREWIIGHHHTTKIEDIDGVLIRIGPAVVPRGAWAAKMGFSSTLRYGQVYVYSVDGLEEVRILRV